MIIVLGINHKTASQDIRAHFVFTKEEIVTFAEIVLQNTEIEELVILSTCNRTEIYYYINKTQHHHNKKISELLLDFKKIHVLPENIFYKHIGIDAVKHLFAVITGIDSLVIGEDQIVSQVKDAYLFCTEKGLTKTVMMRLFQKSFEAAKRARTQTTIQQGPTSVSYVAVDLCSKQFKQLSDKSVLILGSGETNRLALQNLKRKGVEKVFISNRTIENAQTLANEYDGQVIGFEEFHNYLPLCDIVVVATGAQNHLISYEDVTSSIIFRKHKPQVYIDLAVPRNIQKSVETIEHVTLFGIDDLQLILDDTTEKRKQCMEQVQVIINEEAEAYMQWFDNITIRPLIKTITTNMMHLHAKELAIYKKLDGHKNAEIIEEYTSKLTQKYINTLIKNLNEISKNNTSSFSLNVINDLFLFDQKQSNHNE